MLTQEIRQLPGGDGLMIKHTWGKTFRLDRPNVFSLFKFHDEMICPVRGIERYIQVAKAMGLDLSCGYLFRPIAADGSVENTPFSYAATYDRLRHYLTILGLYEGETPHSIRAGCAISLRSSTELLPSSVASGRNTVVAAHVGWFSDHSVKHYTRSGQVDQALAVVQNMARGEARMTGDGYVELSTLEKAF
jgi:hypothetical protein